MDEFFSLYPFLKEVAVIIVIFLIAWVSDMLLENVIRVPKRLENRRSQTLVAVFRSITKVTIYSLALYFIFVFLHINVTPLLASAGIVGLALGFGARSVIEDLIAGIFLLSQDTVGIGDYVKVDQAEGVVESISLRSLFIRDNDGALHIIPNGHIKQVVTYSRGKARVTIDIPVHADQPIDSAIKLFTETLKELGNDPELNNHIMPESAVRGIEDITPKHMIIRTIIVTRQSYRLLAARKFRYLIKKAFEKNKIAFE